MKTGIVFDISHYMIEDGPGIRTNVFMKGCPLRCQWCSNAFGLESGIELSYQPDKCIGCGICRTVCPAGAVSISDGRAVQDFDLCREYGASVSMKEKNGFGHNIPADETFPCITACPATARKQVGRRMTTDEVIAEVLKDQIFYRRGGGGMTVSGGEVLLQAPFVMELLEKGEKHYINNAIETSGFGKWEDLEQMINFCETVFMDVKCMDPLRHQELTGVRNERILENIRKAASLCQSKGKTFVLRLPLIPDRNDREDNLKATAEFAKTLGVELNVLPYHNFGADKYTRIGKNYLLSDLSLSSKEELRRVEEILTSCGARVSMGGYGVQSYDA